MLFEKSNLKILTGSEKPPVNVKRLLLNPFILVFATTKFYFFCTQCESFRYGIITYTTEVLCIINQVSFFEFQFFQMK